MNSLKRKRILLEDSDLDVSERRVWQTRGRVLRTKRSAIWYDDGSVVVQASSTQFRVHRSILSAHSRVLKDMPVETEDTMLVERCPILHLSDSAEDMAHLLKALHDRSYYHPMDPQPVSVVSAILRLSKKYLIDHLRDDTIFRLESEFPSTLKAVDTRHAGCSIELDCPAMIIDAIKLAREAGVLSILPFAFLQLATMDTRVILKGDRRDNDTVAVLSREDREICLLGRDALRLAQEKGMFGWLDGPALDCLTPHLCDRIKIGHGIELWRPSCLDLRLVKWNETDWKTGLCDPCSGIGEKAYEEGRQLVWNKLPSFFGLPDWAELLE